MSGKLRVLIAEDREEDVILLLYELRRRGFDPHYVRVDTEEGLRSALAAEPWDIIITDYSMPRLSGLEVPRIASGAGFDLPVIVVSGIKGEDFAVTAMKAGANDYIVKGNFSRLAPTIEREIKDVQVRRAHKLAEEENRLLNKLLHTSSEINKMIVRETDKDRLLSEACRILVEEGGFRMAFVGMADFRTGKVEVAALSGFDDGYLEKAGIRFDDSPRGIGSSGAAIRTGKYVICKDMETDETFALWRDDMRQRGFRSCASFPLRVRGQVIGVMTVYAVTTAVFEEKMITLLEGLAGDIGYALQALDEAEKRMAATVALRDSEERLRTIFESAMDGMFVVDLEGRYKDVNLAGCQMFGYTQGEILSSDVRLLLFPEDIERRLESSKISLRKGAFIPEIRMRRKDGSEVWVDLAITPFKIGEKELALGVKRDITWRKRAEEAIRESEERFRQIFEQNEDAQLILNYDTCEVIDANPAAVALYGFSREELKEKGPVIFLGQENELKFGESLCCSGMEGFSIERLESERKDGTKIITSVKGQVIRLKNRDVVYCTVRDMTEKIRLEEDARLLQAKLIHANKMTSIGTLAAGVAHEVNNPNNFILFNSTLLFEAWQDALRVLAGYYSEHGEFLIGGLPFTEMRDVVPELISGIIEGSRRIKGIVDNLKDFSRMDKTGLEGEVDVNRSLMAASSILSNQINKYTDNFYVVCGENIPSVKGSAQKIEQVLINLIINALHALPEKNRGVWVYTSYDKETGTVIVKVKDEGVGMPKEVMERITEPFFTTKSGGTGLGLSISYSIIKEHKGSLEFDSEPGRGTTVTLRLPAAASAPEGQQENGEYL